MGIDGAPGGWIAVACFGAGGQRRSHVTFFQDVGELVGWRAEQPGGEEAPVAVDIPIGLPAVVSYRACDEAARARLPGPQKPSVFQAPSRRLLVCATDHHGGRPPNAKVVFERAREVVRDEQQRLDEPLRRLTQQAAGILAKVAEVDAFMREAPAERERWLVEVHPELCFRAMAGGPPPPPKSSAHGQLQRLDLVRREFPDADQRIRAWPGGGRHRLLDVVDAYAACWSALRWAATGGGDVRRRAAVTPPLEVLGETAPGEPAREPETGLAMRMVV
jgi:predicted RNase H-like nuclease